MRLAGIALVGCLALGLIGAGGALAEMVTFNYTDAAQQFTVPPGVTSVTIEAVGAQGGTSFEPRPGGEGARLRATFAVTSEETFNVVAGGEGGAASGECLSGGGGGSFVDTSPATTGGWLTRGGGRRRRRQLHTQCPRRRHARSRQGRRRSRRRRSWGALVATGAEPVKKRERALAVVAY